MDAGNLSAAVPQQTNEQQGNPGNPGGRGCDQQQRIHLHLLLGEGRYRTIQGEHLLATSIQQSAQPAVVLLSSKAPDIILPISPHSMTAQQTYIIMQGCWLVVGVRQGDYAAAM